MATQQICQQLLLHVDTLPRDSGTLIAAHSRDVRVDADGASACAKFIAQRMANGELRMDELFAKSPLHPVVSDFGDASSVAAAAEWIFTADALNFSFWTQDNEPQYCVTFKGTVHTGYIAMCAALNRCLERGIAVTSPAFYADITEERLDEYLMGDDGISCPMIPQRVQCMREISRVLREKHSGSIAALIEKSGKSARALVDLVTTDFECFRDCGVFETAGGPRSVSFYKRAQIFVSDVWALFQGKGLGDFHDIDSLTMFADYRVPQSLQYFGALVYSEALLKTLTSNELLENGSREEMEIRGCSIRGVDLVVDSVAKMMPGHRVNAVLVDYFLWGFRREKEEEMKKFPYHKTRSIYY